MQGAMAALPLPRFPTGLIRGRFGPRDGQLYVCGMYSWAGSQTRPGGFFRIRATGRPIHLPVRVHATDAGLEVTWTEPLDGAVAADPAHFAFKTWSLRRTQNYGSPHINEREHKIRAARLSENGRTLALEIGDFVPTPCYELRYDLRARDGAPVAGELHGTIHQLGP
jgi:hypothetical protein